MNKPLRLKIIEALVTRLQEITTGTGYNFSLDGTGENRQVWHSRTVFGEDEILPCVGVLEDPAAPLPNNPPEDSEGTVRTATLSLLVQGWADKPIQALDGGQDQAYYLLADVQAKLAEIISERRQSANNALLNDMVNKMIVGQAVVRPPDDTSDVAWFWLRVSVEFTEDLADPTWVPYSGA